MVKKKQIYETLKEGLQAHTSKITDSILILTKKKILLWSSARGLATLSNGILSWKMEFSCGCLFPKHHEFVGSDHMNSDAILVRTYLQNPRKRMGAVKDVEEKKAKFQVEWNGDFPLKISLCTLLSSGEIVHVSLVYINLHSYSRTCFHISHEKDACPQLSENKYKQRGLTEITKQTVCQTGRMSTNCWQFKKESQCG